MADEDLVEKVLDATHPGWREVVEAIDFATFADLKHYVSELYVDGVTQLLGHNPFQRSC
ncbi:MAG: hypothetical protein AAB372_01365 [Patescibacteria group bacterium]